MLEDSLLEEKKSLEDLIEKLNPIVEEHSKTCLRLKHVNALLGIDPSGSEQPRLMWSRICRENGLRLRGDSGHRMLKRLKPEIHDAIEHDCLLEL